MAGERAGPQYLLRLAKAAEVTPPRDCASEQENSGRAGRGGGGGDRGKGFTEGETRGAPGHCRRDFFAFDAFDSFD